MRGMQAEITTKATESCLCLQFDKEADFLITPSCCVLLGRYLFALLFPFNCHERLSGSVGAISADGQGGEG